MRRWLGIIAILLALSTAYLGWKGYQLAFRPNVPDSEKGFSIKIPRGAGFDFVLAELAGKGAVKDVGSFEMVAKFRGYSDKVKPGYYKIKSGTTNWDLVNKLRSGAQDELNLRFKSHRAIKEIASEIGSQMEFGPSEIESKMRDDDYLHTFGFSSTTVRSLLIPNTYRVYWTMTVDEFFSKMKQEYDSFWNAERKGLAQQIGLTPIEVSTLASIVQAETYMPKERPVVAGLYLNRIRKKIPLQADPTVIFAHADWSIRRVLIKHLAIDSPYNTYKYQGLPPGPINNPEPDAIDAVLHAEKHDYIFMCAKPDFSGYHNFAVTSAQHSRNAKAYQAAMNRRKIYK
jgi:UPF0755 protein